MLRRFFVRLSFGCSSSLMIAAIASGGCDDTVDSVRSADAGAPASDGSSAPVDGATDAAPDARADAAVCNDVVNAAPIVRATHVYAPFPNGAGQGGEFASGRYFLTTVTYYGEVADAGGADAGDADAGDAGVGDASAGEPVDIYWRTTIDATVTLGTDLQRAWHTGKVANLSDSGEHHESLTLEPATTTTVKLQSVCSDLPIMAIVEYTATPTSFTLYLPDPGRVETYVKQ